jgi:hypothetical protein
MRSILIVITLLFCGCAPCIDTCGVHTDFAGCHQDTANSCSWLLVSGADGGTTNFEGTCVGANGCAQ